MPPSCAPHTVESCAGDLAALCQHIGKEAEVLIAHSFSGKIALRCVCVCARVWGILVCELVQIGIPFFSVST